MICARAPNGAVQATLEYHEYTALLCEIHGRAATAVPLVSVRIGEFMHLNCQHRNRSFSGVLVSTAAVIALLAGCSPIMKNNPASLAALDRIATAYVHLVLALGEHDADYVDAYYGPPEWREEARRAAVSLEQIRSGESELRMQLDATNPPDEMQRARRHYLQKQLQAMDARIEMLQGHPLPFDVESQRTFDAVAPQHDAAYFDALLQQLDALLPGTGATSARYTAYRRKFIISPDRLDRVFQQAVMGCRSRTLQRIALPEDEHFKIEYVKNKPWSGYNWYQGNDRSLIQVNTDLPIYIDRAVDLACHEGYPGHHVYNVLLENNLVRERRWIEFTVYPLFSPQSLIAEGSANYGIELAFPGDERWQWERDHLFALAGLDPAQAERYYAVFKLAARLSFAGNEAARRYLDGKIDAAQAASWLQQYALMSAEHAKQRVGFIEKYRSYVINYNLGQELVKNYVETLAGTDHEKQWQVFAQLLSAPYVPSQLMNPQSHPSPGP